MTGDRTGWSVFFFVLLGGLGACSEPEDRITGSTADNQFSLLLEAEKNWVRAEHVLPIRVTLASSTGPFDRDRTERVDLLVNNGSVSPSYIDFDFAARDTLFDIAGDTTLSEWITFAADRDVTSSQQGEVIALLEDLQVTFKIRFVDVADQ